MSERVTVTIDGNVAVVSIDTPPVNALSVEVLRDLLPCP
jgi:enoyl-CoA hydratase/carnithine racemase